MAEFGNARWPRAVAGCPGCGLRRAFGRPGSLGMRGRGSPVRLTVQGDAVCGRPWP